MPSPLQANAEALEQELLWFTQVVDTRFSLFFGQESALDSVSHIEPPNLEKSSSFYAEFVNLHKMTFAERLCLILALTPYIRPRLLDVFFTKNKTFDRKFTEFGGIKQGSEGDFIPTGETLAFLLGGQSLDTRFEVLSLLDRDHFFNKKHILDLQAKEVGHSSLKAPLLFSVEYLSLFTTGEKQRPHFGQHFPARHIQTNLDWEDLVLHPGTLGMVKEIETWITHGDTLLGDWQMDWKIRPGYRALFYGPPGTGKTFTASLLGKSTGHEVYRVDLSTVISKYIGETEKNLSRVFDMAENKKWILFFDEADALFGKRTETRDSHDRYANQEVSYLLQRIETFKGIAILASNLKDNLDQAFTRRFESIIYFPIPGPQERFLIWEKGFSPKSKLEKTVDLRKLANDYELSGATIMNVIRYASLQALEQGGNIITLTSLLQGIKREYVKEGRMG